MMDVAVMMFLGSLHQAGSRKGFPTPLVTLVKMRQGTGKGGWVLVPCKTGTEVSLVKSSHLGLLTEVYSGVRT